MTTFYEAELWHFEMKFNQLFSLGELKNNQVTITYYRSPIRGKESANKEV